jgi:HEPN domain-containing protein
MRDERFRAKYRGEGLGAEEHRLLAVWAADCAERVLPLFTAFYPQDHRPQKAIETVRAWAKGEATLGEARAAAFAAQAALEAAAKAAARAAGQAVSTAHMADHSLGAAYSAVKAVRAANGGDEAAANLERSWQRARLPEKVWALVQAAEADRRRGLGYKGAPRDP